MNWISFILISLFYVIAYVSTALRFRKIVTKLQSEKFDLNWEHKDLKNKYNEMENALVLISEGDLLKREMVEIAQEVLGDCDGSTVVKRKISQELIDRTNRSIYEESIKYGESKKMPAE